MGYQIIDKNIVSKDTQGSTRKFLQSSVDKVISECKRQGISNKYLIAGILAVISKESGFVPQNENLNYSKESLLKTFPSKFGEGKENPEVYAKKPEKIANYVYAGRYGNSLPGDGFKYRGRGFNQITFKDIYKKYESNLPGIVETPELLNNIDGSAIISVSFYVDSFKNIKVIKKKFNKSAYDISDWDEALLLVVNATAGLGNSIDSQAVRYNYDKAKLCHQFLIDYLEKIPDKPKEPANIPAPDNVIEDNPIDQQEQTPTKDISNSPVSGLPITSLVQFFKPKISPSEINFDATGLNERDKAKIQKTAGFLPLVWYNGYQIGIRDVRKLNLYHNGILPALEITFLDSLGILREDGYPNDDTLITVYINSKSLNLRSIHMDFKILNFKDSGDGLYTITGICNIPRIYISQFISYNNKSSHEALQEVAKQIGIGFCSNIQNSDDRMTWINTGDRFLDFIESIIKNSYVSETSFQYCYIDFYYNLCYVDINKEMERDVSLDKMISSTGIRFLQGGGEENSELEESVIPLLLSNDKGLKESSGYFSNFEISNRSTRISLQKSYRTRSKYYDSITKELLIFDIESQTSDGSKSIILKAAINDDEFFKDNSNNIWIGKQDVYDNGKGNIHTNYNYAIIQNRINLDDITKIFCKITLPSNNLNLYLYQKVPIHFAPQKKTTTIERGLYKRITGDWLITAIEYIFEGGSSRQIITAIKRELSLLPEEVSDSTSPKISNIPNNENNTNDISPNDI